MFRWTFKALGAAIAALVVWEAILRVFVVDLPEPRIGTVRMYSEGFGVSHWNSAGLRGPEIGPKGPDAFRILFLGDSFTEALHVRDEEAFSGSIQRAIQQVVGGRRKVEAYNGGRSGASPATVLVWADKAVRDVSPDAVVVAWGDEAYGTFLDRAFVEHKDAYIDPKPGGGYALVDERNPIDMGIRRPRLRARITRAIKAGFRSSFLIGTRRLREGLAGAKAPAASAQGSGPSMAGSAGASPIDRFLASHPGIVEWSIGAFHKKFPRLVVVHLGGTGRPAADLPESMCEREVRLACERYGVPFVAMRPVFVETYLRTGTPVNGFDNSEPGVGHLNPLGHSLVASRLVPIVARFCQP